MFCKKCGKELPEGAKFCEGCGAPVGGAQAKETPKNSFEETVKNLGNTADVTGDFDAADIAKNKVLALFAYIGILFLIPLLAAPNSKFARFHTNQGLVLFITGVIWGVISGIVNLIVGGVPVLGSLFSILSALVSLALFILAILGIINACTGKAKELPLVGTFKILK